MIVWAARELLALATLAPSIDDPRHPGQTTPAALRGCRGQGTPGWPGVSVAAIAVNRTSWIGAEGRLRGLTTGGADRAMAPSRSSLRASARGGWARNLATIIGPGGASRIATVALQQLAAAQLRFALDHRRRRAARRLTPRCRLLPSRCCCGVPARRVSPLASPSGHGDGDGLGQILGVALAIGASVEKSLHATPGSAGDRPREPALQATPLGDFLGSEQGDCLSLESHSAGAANAVCQKLGRLG